MMSPGVGVADAGMVGEGVGRVHRDPLAVPCPALQLHRVRSQDSDHSPANVNNGYK